MKTLFDIWEDTYNNCWTAYSTAGRIAYILGWLNGHSKIIVTVDMI